MVSHGVSIDGNKSMGACLLSCRLGPIGDLT
jgi:hypothetical protein